MAGHIPLEISALVPVYSETDLLVETLSRLKASLGARLHEFLIIASPKSSQECLDLCHDLARTDPLVRTYIQSERPGIGWAYRELIPRMTGTHGLVISSDLETNPDDASRMADAAAGGADMVCGSRWLPGGGFDGYDPFKLLLNYGYNLIFRTLYGIRIHDITFGYRLIKAEVLRKVRWEYGRHEFCAELLLKPVRLGCTAVEVPTRWIKRPEGESKNAFMRNFKFAAAAWKIRFAERKSFLVSEPEGRAWASARKPFATSPTAAGAPAVNLTRRWRVQRGSSR
jgi:glycosyltransferase involved in cell wall biosynthesis